MNAGQAKPHRLTRLAATAATALLLAACGDGDGARAEDAAAVTPMARGIVDVDGGVVRIPAARSGLVRRVAVREGDYVASGAILAEIDSREGELKRDAIKAVLAERRAIAAAAETKAANAKTLKDKMERLASANAAGPQEVSDAVAAASAAESERAQAQAAVAEADADLRLAELDVEAHTVRAPLAGTILRAAGVEGGFVRVDDPAPLFVLAPDRPRIVRAELDESFARLVTVGMTASVLDDSAPDQPGREARVSRVADAFEAASLTPTDDPHPDSRVLRVTLAIGQTAGLRLGQRVTVRFGP